MVRLADIQKQAGKLSREDRLGLIMHLLHTLEKTDQGPDDYEVLQRGRDLESGDVKGISHEEFVRKVRLGRR